MGGATSHYVFYDSRSFDSKSAKSTVTGTEYISFGGPGSASTAVKGKTITSGSHGTILTHKDQRHGVSSISSSSFYNALENLGKKIKG